uniref:Small ribosomal subunit protein uS5 n=1 Tax=Loxodonta africana TaxID=9785 RepID=G3U9H7_LOXAF
INLFSLEDIYLFSLSIKESGIITFFLGMALKNEVLKIMPMQKQARSGQQTRVKAFNAIGDYNGHLGLHIKCSKEVAMPRGTIILAKLSIIPMWGDKTGKPHSVPCKVTSRLASTLVCLVPPRGTGIVSAPVTKKLLLMASIDGCYTSARGYTLSLDNFTKATFDAISKTYSYLTPTSGKRPCPPSLPTRNSLAISPESQCRGPRLQLWPPHSGFYTRK